MSRTIDISAWLLNDSWTQKIAPLNPYRTLISAAASPIQKLLHETQSKLRVFPESVRRAAEPLQILSAASSLLVESSTQDLLDSLSLSQVQMAGISPFPKTNSTQAVSAACESNSDRLFFIACPLNEDDLAHQMEFNPRAIRLFPALTGHDEHHAFHIRAIEQAQQRKIPILVETSSFHANTLLKDPSLSRATRFEGWFRNHPNQDFVLIGMNGDEPQDALGLAKTYPKVWLEISWQPPEVLVQTQKALGDYRLLFGSQWPLLGKSQEIAIERLQQASRLGAWSESTLEAIAGANAARLFPWIGDHE